MRSTASSEERLIIYQVLPRLLTNQTSGCVPNGTLAQNGSGKMADYTPRLLDSIRDLGANCIWFTGIIENATKSDFSSYGIIRDFPCIVKGEAGSPYAIKDYYDINPCLAVDVERRMQEFEALTERVHDSGMKMIIDFVPNHTARRYHSDAKPDGVSDFGTNDDITKMFDRDNNYYYITNQQFSPQVDIANGAHPYVEFPSKATGNDCFTAYPTANDWYETVKLNYGFDYGDGSEHFNPVPDTWFKMLDILKFWASKGVDGFRCDMVFMVPLAFWHWVIPVMKTFYPDLIFIGEIYDVGQYRPFIDYGCFDYLYDKVNLYDTLKAVEQRHQSAARLTGCWQTVDGIGDRMLNFIENHDEVRFGSKSYAGNPANVIPSLVVSSMMSKGPFMIYFGQELGESAHDNEGFAGDNDRTSIFDYWSYDTMRRWYDGGRCSTNLLTEQEKWLRALYGKVLNLCNSCSSLRSGDFFDLMYVNLQNPDLNPDAVFAFLRYVKDKEAVLVVANFSDRDTDIKLNIPPLAFSMSGMTEGSVDAIDLLSTAICTLHLSSSMPLSLSVAAKNAKVLQFPINRTTIQQ